MSTAKAFSTQRRFLSDIVFSCTSGKSAEGAGSQKKESFDRDVVLTEAINERRVGGARQFRNLVIELRPLKGCIGSAKVELGNTRVCCAVTGPKEQQSGETALEGLLNISLQGCVDPAMRYSVEHALQAVVCLKKLARTEVDIELNVLSDDGGVLAVCLLAAGLAIASAKIEMFDILLACNLLVPQQPASPPGFPPAPAFILDPDQATISRHGPNSAFFTLAITPANGQLVSLEFGGGSPLPVDLCKQLIPVAFKHCMELYERVRQALLLGLEDEDVDNSSGVVEAVAGTRL